LYFLKKLVERMNKDFKINEINTKDDDSIPLLQPYDIYEDDSSDDEDEDEDEQEEADNDFFKVKSEHKIDLNLGSQKIDRKQ
jgi:hypothetical protein